MEGQMTKLAQTLLFSAFFLAPMAALADTAEEANAAIERWSAAYTSNDPDAVVKTYAPDAILLGTISPIMSEGTEALQEYFAGIKGSGNKNELGERRTIVIDDNAVLVTGFYEFIRMKDGQPTPTPARFTMLVTKGNGEWRIAHHHSSVRPQPQQ
jgi:uncharacterized protein (TIGR02246 family)